MKQSFSTDVSTIDQKIARHPRYHELSRASFGGDDLQNDPLTPQALSLEFSGFVKIVKDFFVVGHSKTNKHPQEIQNLGQNYI
jgi:hypothetical protein